MASAGSFLPELRLGLIITGLLGVGVALAIRWNLAQPSYLGRLSPIWHSFTLLALSGMFHLLSVVISAMLFLSFFWPIAYYPWRWGPILVCWVFVAPMSTIAAIQCYRRSGRDEPFNEREETSLLLVLAAVACQAAIAAMYDKGRPLHLDTIRFFLGVASVAALIGAPVVLAPQRVRRRVISLLFVLHFVSISAAALLGFRFSLVLHQFNSRISRPYLNFFVVGNPHAYFAEEASPNQVWFRIIFEDGTREWLKLPEVDGRGNHKLATQVNLTRYSGLVQSVTGSTPPVMFDLNARPLDFFRVRLEAAHPSVEQTGGMYVPFLSESQISVPQQCQMPTPGALRVLRSYLLHVICKAQQDGRRVKAVKVYRVRHQLLNVQEYLKGVKEPWDPDTYVTYYMGDFDSQGDQINPMLPFFYAGIVASMCPTLEGLMLASSPFCSQYYGDPLLYWALPTVRDGTPGEPIFRCYVRKHAGDPAWIRNAQGEWVESEPTR